MKFNAAKEVLTIVLRALLYAGAGYLVKFGVTQEQVDGVVSELLPYVVAAALAAVALAWSYRSRLALYWTEPQPKE